MPFGNRTEPLVISVLDRLLTEPKQRPDQSVNGLLESVRRDLQNLLNTRWRCESWPPDLKQLQTSLINYGIPDFTGTRFTSPGSRRELAATIEDAIARFEPRLADARVSVEEVPDDNFGRTLKFRIVAYLQTKPAPEVVQFDTKVRTTTGDVTVEEADA
jgi:type VI secretion system protein ImpF